MGYWTKLMRIELVIPFLIPNDSPNPQIYTKPHSLQHSHVELALQIAQVFANHLFAESLPSDEEARDTARRVL